MLPRGSANLEFSTGACEAAPDPDPESLVILERNSRKAHSRRECSLAWNPIARCVTAALLRMQERGPGQPGVCRRLLLVEGERRPNVV